MHGYYQCKIGVVLSKNSLPQPLSQFHTLWVYNFVIRFTPSYFTQSSSTLGSFTQGDQTLGNLTMCNLTLENCTLENATPCKYILGNGLQLGVSLPWVYFF